MTEPFIDRDLAATKAFHQLKGLLGDPVSPIPAIAQTMVVLASENTADDRTINEEIFRGVQVLIDRRDLGRALSLLAEIHTAAPSNSGLKERAELMWVELVSNVGVMQRPDLFTPLNHSFAVAADPNFKTDIAFNLVEVSPYHCISDKGMDEARTALAAVHAFAVRQDDSALAAAAEEKLALMAVDPNAPTYR